MALKNNILRHVAALKSSFSIIIVGNSIPIAIAIA